jgi:hypothetical protein
MSRMFRSVAQPSRTVACQESDQRGRRAKTLIHRTIVLREGGMMYYLFRNNGELGELGEKRRKD